MADLVETQKELAAKEKSELFLKPSFIVANVLRKVVLENFIKQILILSEIHL